MPQPKRIKERIKEYIRILDVAKNLGVTEIESEASDICLMNCSICEKDKLKLYINTDTFACSTCKASGDVMALVMFIKKCNERDATVFLHDLLPKEFKMWLHPNVKRKDTKG